MYRKKLSAAEISRFNLEGFPGGEVFARGLRNSFGEWSFLLILVNYGVLTTGAICWGTIILRKN
ncbi:MAG: hypothetical protein CM1200mP16_03640 [Nitrospina sp.]|nr:MAG: hypothetical protein CM1200mP16_03640 [Nitrospina sp.]